MKIIRNLTAVALLMCCVLSMTACGFYELFVDENDTSSGVYVAIYNKDSTDEELSAISDVSFMKSDLINEIKEYDLSFEVTERMKTPPIIAKLETSTWVPTRWRAIRLSSCLKRMGIIRCFTMSVPIMRNWMFSASSAMRTTEAAAYGHILIRHGNMRMLP